MDSKTAMLAEGQAKLNETAPRAANELPELFGITPERFSEIQAEQRPVILRGAARDWPIVSAGLHSPDELSNYLLNLDNGSDVLTAIAEPEFLGRLGYRPGTDRLNHDRAMLPLGEVLRNILDTAETPSPPAYWIGGLPADNHLPGLRAENDIDLTPPEAEPHLTICNRVTIPAHIDSADNIAIVAGGRRRFTVFPPDQVENLYVGPLDPTPAGVPISLVNQDAPDFEKFPRFADALEAGYTADLEPGDAIFIPYLWWHGVQSRDDLNVLVNFWWYSHEIGAELPWIPMLNAAHQLFRDMPPLQRAAWRSLFDYWAFSDRADPVAHLTMQQRSGGMSNHIAARFRDEVAELLRPETQE